MLGWPAIRQRSNDIAEQDTKSYTKLQAWNSLFKVVVLSPPDDFYLDGTLIKTVQKVFLASWLVKNMSQV